jgi:hypothetical protein
MRWLPFARVSSQRVGSLLAVTAAATDARATSLEGITRAYEPTLRRGVRVPEERSADVHTYLNRQHLWERYRSLKKADASALVGVEIQAQDYWLADPALPSASGAITDRVTDEPPQLAAALQLLRTANYTLTDRGKAMRMAMDASTEAIRRGDTATGNPFLLSPGASLFFLYVLLEEDFDFLRAAYATQLPDIKETFSRMDFALRLDEACEQLRVAWVRRVRSGTDRERVSRLSELAKKIREVRDGKTTRRLETWGGGRTPDQLATVRLEPLVDTGVLGRARFDYVYSLSPDQRAFFESLIEAESADDFLERKLFGAYLASIGIAPVRTPSDEVWERIEDAHAALRSNLGYAAFKEVVVLAMARLADERLGACFELHEGIEVIKEQSRLQPRAVQFGIRRGGGLTYVKIAESGRKR